MKFEWVRRFLALPRKVVTDGGTVLFENCRTLVRSPSRENFREVEFNPGNAQPLSVTRRALVVI